MPAPVASRIAIEGVTPEIDEGRYPIKRVPGELVVVEADIFSDGHDAVSAVLKFRRAGQERWEETAFEPLVNDRWRARFRVDDLGVFEYTLAAWVDRFQSWRRDLGKRLAAAQDVEVDLLVGAGLVEAAAGRAQGRQKTELSEYAERLRDPSVAGEARGEIGTGDPLAGLIGAWPDRSRSFTYGRILRVTVDAPRARFSAWYEMFPRSCTDREDRHGTLRDCEARLEYVKSMGFDVVYLPPIHPIGATRRKGRNNLTQAGPDDVGSPWAIGSPEGGHDAIHPALGTVEDFERFVRKAADSGIAVAIDLAFQCSPDHPYVTEHPEWFRMRPDGSVQYAENPPKKYEDIYPFDFDGDAAGSLGDELERVIRVWIERGVRTFRVDNPHTKPFYLWERLIGNLRSEFPDLVFLAEAFTRPKVMYRLAKVGFDQSYTYFAWRNTKWELTRYFTELTQGPVREYFRPSLWPNTPDILTEYLQSGGRPAFAIRLVLAATLGASYGIYGPAFELLEGRAREPGSEEYLESEKYQVRAWDLERADSLRDLIARVNRIRRENPALQSNDSLMFHATDNEQVICYSKHDLESGNAILVAVNLDPYRTHSAWLEAELETIGMGADEQFQVHDLLSDARYLWRDGRGFVQLDPSVMPAHVFRVRRRIRTERDFDYFM